MYDEIDLVSSSLNYVLGTVEQTDICSAALGKELFADLGGSLNCCSELYLYFQLRILYLELHSASRKKLLTKWLFQLFWLHPLLGL